VTLLRQGVGLGDPQRSLPTPAILSFCDSVTPVGHVSNEKLSPAARLGAPTATVSRGASSLQV